PGAGWCRGGCARRARGARSARGRTRGRRSCRAPAGETARGWRGRPAEAPPDHPGDARPADRQRHGLVTLGDLVVPVLENGLPDTTRLEAERFADVLEGERRPGVAAPDPTPGGQPGERLLARVGRVDQTADRVQKNG